MEISHLRLLQALVEDPHLSRTADRLRITQSALSKRVQALEAEIGRPLFERRGPRGLKPLPSAIELAKTAEQVLQSWESGLKKIGRTEDEPEHFVLVGPEILLREVVLPWWVKEGPSFPRQELEVRTPSLSRVSLETVQAGADAGILEHREELASYVCKPFYQEHWGIVRHPGKRHEDLRKYVWGTNSVSNNPVDTWLVRRGRMPVPTYRIYWEDLTALTIWVAETPGAATVLPWHAARWLSKRGRVVFESLGKDAIQPLYLAYPRKSPHRELIASMLRIGREQAEEIG
jgi:DNA-binding transcriptional LysR family regulator